MSKISAYLAIDALSLEDESVINDASESNLELKTKKWTMQQLVDFLDLNLANTGRRIYEVAYATTANITTSGNLTIDGGASLANGTKVLVKDQTDPIQNGVYVVAASTWSRDSNFDSGAELDGALIYVRNGTTNAARLYWQSEDTPLVGTDDVVFDLINSSTGGGSGGGSEITNGTKQTALQLNSNWGTTSDYTPVMQSNISTVTTGQSEHDYFYGTDSVTGSIYKYEIIKIATVLSVIRIPLKY
jgi:hypothetical protein